VEIRGTDATLGMRTNMYGWKRMRDVATVQGETLAIAQDDNEGIRLLKLSVLIRTNFNLLKGAPKYMIKTVCNNGQIVFLLFFLFLFFLLFFSLFAFFLANEQNFTRVPRNEKKQNTT
jgi:hypothetical protein